MSENEEPQAEKEERRLQGVLALLAGQPAITVCQQYQIGRSALYKFKRRALAAMREAMREQPRGPHRPPNRLPTEKEQQVKTICQ